MSILTQLRKLEKDRTRFKEIGKTATENYQALQPKYSQAVQSAKNYQSTLTKDYELYREDYNTAVASYNEDLKSRKGVYESVLAQGQGLESNFTSASQTLGQLGTFRDQAATEANRLYGTYEKEYQSAISSALESYESQLKNLQIVQDYQELIGLKQEQLKTANSTAESQGITNYINWAESNLDNIIKSNNLEGKTLSEFQADTDYVTRIAQEQSAGSLQNYQNYLQNTYNPSVNTYNQYASETYNPAAQAYQNFQNSGKVQQSLQSYQDLVKDTGYVDRASSDTKSVYDASAKKYKDLQTAYQSLEEPLSRYVTEATTAANQVKQLNSQLPGLQRSLRVEQDPRKRETRIGYGRSLMTSGTKRRSSAR